MTKYLHRPSVEEDCALLAPRMKKADVDELWAFARMRPVQALKHSLMYSHESFTVEVDGQVEMMYGIGQPSLLSLNAIPWMLSSDAVYDPEHRRHFLKGSAEWLELMKFMYPRMVNFVDGRAKKTIVWLKRLGFTIDEPELMGRDEIPFHRFHIGLES